ncbi:hypothetical protein BDV95DRAFT_598987 [Massariosphaeria phaeospora]|uniref:Uncharacterized protein n=1 Tax=Massariosphaeria phaeospora TaxID=100035 RepID=A0A7C8MG88_9PLEO|nr:hypothetical protein BDV95DRAFT_598987 [Massariosphaeria phaeospora]
MAGLSKMRKRRASSRPCLASSPRAVSTLTVNHTDMIPSSRAYSSPDSVIADTEQPHGDTTPEVQVTTPKSPRFIDRSFNAADYGSDGLFSDIKTDLQAAQAYLTLGAEISDYQTNLSGQHHKMQEIQAQTTDLENQITALQARLADAGAQKRAEDERAKEREQAVHTRSEKRKNLEQERGEDLYEAVEIVTRVEKLKGRKRQRRE